MLIAENLNINNDVYNCTPTLFHIKRFFQMPIDKRIALLDCITFVREIAAFMTVNGNEPMNEAYMSRAEKFDIKTLLIPVGRSSMQQIKDAQKNGFKICIGKINSLDDLIHAIQSSPDYILLPEAIDTETLRKYIEAIDPAEVEAVAEQIDIFGEDSSKLNFETTKIRPEGTDLRVISFNILTTFWNHQPAVEPRSAGIVKALEGLKPDLGGLQEAEIRWYNELKDKIAPYSFVILEDEDLQGSITPRLIYNSEKFRQIESGLLPYTDKWLRCLHWAILEDKESGKRLILTNTHWDLTAEKRMANAKLMCEYISALKEKYRLPVICTGDYNCTSESEEFNYFLNTVSLKDSLDASPVKENETITSSFNPKFVEAPRKESEVIDHAVISEELIPLAARLVVDPDLLRSTDHIPLISDLKFK